MFKTKINEVKNNFNRYMTSRMRQMNIVVLKKSTISKSKSLIDKFNRRKEE